MYSVPSLVGGFIFKFWLFLGMLLVIDFLFHNAFIIIISIFL